MRHILLSIIVLTACGDDAVVVDLDPTPVGADAAVGDVALDQGNTEPDAATQPEPQPVPLRDDARDDVSWLSLVQSSIDSSTLAASFAAAGYTMPAGSAVVVAPVEPGAQFARYQYFDAGLGAFDTSFWPASTIKLLSALGALEWVNQQGHTGAATVAWDSGFADNLGSIVDRALRVSSNIDYDRTLRAAGWDFMNADFLTPENGFPQTVITGSYASVEVRNPGGYWLRENGKETYVPGRAGLGEYGRNDTNLIELTEAVRRVLLDSEIPEHERFKIADADKTLVRDALCGATPSYFKAGADAALGSSQICHKPGWVPNNECLDHGLITDGSGRRFLLAAQIPYQDNCPGLSTLAQRTLAAVESLPITRPIQANHGGIVVQVDTDGVTIDAPADSLRAQIDGVELDVNATGTNRFRADTVLTRGDHQILVWATRDGVPSAFRAATLTAN